MGRAYILFGEPTSRHPFVGYSQIYPMELWFYENNTSSPALPAFFYLLFYINGDIGDYKFYRPFLDGPMKLVRGSQFNSNRDVYKFLQPMGGDVAHAIMSLVPSEPVDTVNYQPDMSSDMLIARIENFANNPVQCPQAARDAIAARQGQFYFPGESGQARRNQFAGSGGPHGKILAGLRRPDRRSEAGPARWLPA